MNAKVFLLFSCCTVFVRSAQVMRKNTLKYQSGSFGNPNWSGSLYCPMDYGINIKTIIQMVEPCSGLHCNTYAKYTQRDLKDIHASCNSHNTCDVKIWQKSNMDVNDIVIGYVCRSLMECNLFRNKMVKRLYSDSDVDVNNTTTYCNEIQSRQKRQNSVKISRYCPQYSFDDAIAARELLARARVRGYGIVEYDLTSSNVFRMIISRTRRHADGNDIVLPVYVAANLTIQSLQSSLDRSPFPSNVNAHLTRCGIRRGDNNTDDGGHLVAYTLGGSDALYNLVPMARDLNRRQGILYRHEDEVRNFLRGHIDGMVTWEVLVIYGIGNEERYRPVAFTLRYTTYEDRHNLNNGIARIETFINENVHFGNDQCTFNFNDFFRPSRQQDPDIA